MSHNKELNENSKEIQENNVESDQSEAISDSELDNVSGGYNSNPYKKTKNGRVGTKSGFRPDVDI